MKQKTLLATAMLVFSYSACFSHIFVFVSYSMPDAALKAYFAEAERHQKATGESVNLVMKGLHQDSFLASKQKAESIGVVYQIEPDFFEKYGVSRVPVIVRDNQGEVHKITGHIPLSAALTEFESNQ